MDIFDILNFIGGISLFLFGMSVMGSSLEARAGNKIKTIIDHLSTNRLKGLLTGLGVTAIIQSSSATTVIVVGFVNSGLMSLKQAINVIMGANIGTTVTSWILSLSGISSSNVFIKLLKPTSFSPIMALIGVILIMFFKDDKKKDTGMILLGFATLMFGMETMSSAVSGLKEVEGFRQLFIMFSNPILGILVGAGVTAIIQSSSASVGILQAFAATGQITYSSAIPIIMGQNIGTCVTAMISSIGANKNAKRASLVHLSFNVIGTLIFLVLYLIVCNTIDPLILHENASMGGIAVVHSGFNIITTALLFPFVNQLEKLVYIILPEKEEKKDDEIVLDERLFISPSIALEQAYNCIKYMASVTKNCLTMSVDNLNDSKESNIVKVKEKEKKTDQYEDKIGSYLVKLSSKELNEQQSRKIGEYLKIIGDLERIGDHSRNLSELKQEMLDNETKFSASANKELTVLCNAIEEVSSNACLCLESYDYEKALMIEPLEEVIDELNEEIRNRHINRLKNEKCNVTQGIILEDILSNLERVSDHCANIAGCIIDDHMSNMNMHENIKDYIHNSETYKEYVDEYRKKYLKQLEKIK